MDVAGVNMVPIDALHPFFGSKPVHTEARLTIHVFLRHHCQWVLSQAARVTREGFEEVMVQEWDSRTISGP